MNLEQEIIELKERIEKLELILGTKKQTGILEVNPKSPLSHDKTKYIFEGKILSKNRLVLAIVNAYVTKYNPTFEKLKNSFDKSLQGSLGVISLIDEAKKISDGSKRFFMKEDEIITLNSGEKIVVCTQWGSFNINRFIKQATNLGFEIEEI